MTKTRWVVGALCLAGSGVWAGCAGSDSGTKAGALSCVAGATSACGCGAGVMATQTCLPTGSFGLCECPAGTPVGDANAASAGSGAQGNAGGSALGTAGFGASGAGAAGSGAAGSGAAGVGASGSSGSNAAGSGGGGGTAAAADGGTAGTGVTTSGADPKIPTVTDTCPTLATGTVSVLGQQVQLWVGAKQADKKGAVFFYWHGTGSQSSEAQVFMGSQISEITSEGGIVASFTTSLGSGSPRTSNIWSADDYKMADIILACAVKQLNIDTRRVYSGGCSAGGLQSGSMVYLRSSYLAGAMPNSGGLMISPPPMQDSHVPALITTHGKMGTDVVVLDFSTTSLNECKDIAAKGGFAVDCDHGGQHCGAPAAVISAQWEFLKAHPFGVSPEPYAAGLPATFPSYCKIIN